MGVAVQADVQHLRAAVQLPECARALIDSEEEVTPPLRHEDRRRHRAELGQARARGGPGLHGRLYSPANAAAVARRRATDRVHRIGNRAREPGDEAGLHEPLRHERRVEIGPRLDRRDSRPRNAGHERVEDCAAAVGDAPGADHRVRDVRTRGEPVVHRRACRRSRAGRRSRRARRTRHARGRRTSGSRSSLP